MFCQQAPDARPVCCPQHLHKAQKKIINKSMFEILLNAAFHYATTTSERKLNGVADRLGCPVDEECPSSMCHIRADRKRLCHSPEMSPTTSHQSSVAPTCSSINVSLRSAPSESPYQQYCSLVGSCRNGWQSLLIPALPNQSVHDCSHKISKLGPNLNNFHVNT